MSGRTVSKKTAEYLRRNELHAASVGALAGVHAVFRRVLRLNHRPQWLVDGLIEIGSRLERVSDEMAAHRDEVKKRRKR